MSGERAGQNGREGRDLPVVAPEEWRRHAPAETVGGVLLAAGTSSRFGAANKLLATVDGEPLVRRAAASLLAGGVCEVVVVVGHEAERVRAALEGLDVAFVENPDYERGQSTSVAAGARAAADRGWDAAVFALGDMPFVASESVGALRRAYAGGEWTVLAAAHEGERGNPVLFDARHFDALRDVEGDVGGRDLIRGEGAALVETLDPGVVRDVDRAEDLPGDERGAADE